MNHFAASRFAAALVALGLALMTDRGAQAEWGGPYFSDDFSGSPGKHFYEGVLDGRQFRYVSGEYEIDTMQGTSYGQSILLAELEDYRVEATGWLESSAGASQGFGISFNYQEAAGDETGADFMLFLIYGRGAFAVLRYLDGETSLLLAPAKTKLFSPGERVDMAVENHRGEAVCFINGVEAGRVRDDRLRGGGFGLFCTAGSIARFDDFIVYAEAHPEHETQFEDFATASPLYSGIIHGVKYSYDRERYVIDTLATDYAGLSPFPRRCRDFEFSADVELLGGDSGGGIGFYLREYEEPEGWYNHYRFLISGRWFGLEQSKDQHTSALADWRESAALKEGQANRLSVRAQGGRISCYINGEEVYSLDDADTHIGALGFYAAPGVKAAFDNAELTILDE